MLGNGKCSTTGYDKLKDVFRDSMTDVVNSEAAINAFNKFRVYIGGLGDRQIEECIPDLHIVRCKLLEFPPSEHACQLAKRVQKLFNVVVRGCKMSNKWNRKWSVTMQRLLTNSLPTSGTCPELISVRRFGHPDDNSDDYGDDEFNEMVTMLIEQEMHRLADGNEEISKNDRKQMMREIFTEDESSIPDRLMELDMVPTVIPPVGYTNFY